MKPYEIQLKKTQLLQAPQLNSLPKEVLTRGRFAEDLVAQRLIAGAVVVKELREEAAGEKKRTTWGRARGKDGKCLVVSCKTTYSFFLALPKQPSSKTSKT